LIESSLVGFCAGNNHLAHGWLNIARGLCDIAVIHWHITPA